MTLRVGAQRHRSADYRRAISTGAPEALQEADRFHVAKNAGEILERVIQHNHQGVSLAVKAVDQKRAPTTPPATEAPQPPQSIPSLQTESAPAQSLAQQRRRAHYQEVTALATEGLGPTAIAQRVGLTRQTVARWLRAGSFPERPPSAPRRMRITPYEPYLRERWQAGAQHSRQLWREIEAKGFTGGCETVRRLPVQWRTERGRSGPPKRHASQPPLGTPSSSNSPTLTATDSMAAAQAGRRAEAGATTVSGAPWSALP